MPIQRAAVVAFEGGDDVDRYLVQVRRVLAALGRFTARRLQSYGVRCAQPTGGFYVFPDFGTAIGGAGLESSVVLCERLLAETGVALAPGEAFGRPPAELTARLAYVDFDGPRALAAVGVIPKEQPVDETFLRRHCAPVVEAVERIGAWVERTRAR
jgi:aspartate aminotransferase